MRKKALFTLVSAVIEVRFLLTHFILSISLAVFRNTKGNILNCSVSFYSLNDLQRSIVWVAVSAVLGNPAYSYEGVEDGPKTFFPVTTGILKTGLIIELSM